MKWIRIKGEELEKIKEFLSYENYDNDWYVSSKLFSGKNIFLRDHGEQTFYVLGFDNKIYYTTFCIKLCRDAESILEDFVKVANKLIPNPGISGIYSQEKKNTSFCLELFADEIIEREIINKVAEQATSEAFNRAVEAGHEPMISKDGVLFRVRKDGTFFKV
jgi:hypothetical protein